jgi:hypothetical protein
MKTKIDTAKKLVTYELDGNTSIVTDFANKTINFYFEDELIESFSFIGMYVADYIYFINSFKTERNQWKPLNLPNETIYLQ